MRVYNFWQRNIAGLTSLVQANRHCDIHSRISSQLRRYSQSYPIETRAEAELKEFFKRVPWPTTPQEERMLVASVGTVIWEGQNGGMLLGVIRVPLNTVTD